MSYFWNCYMLSWAITCLGHICYVNSLRFWWSLCKHLLRSTHGSSSIPLTIFAHTNTASFTTLFACAFLVSFRAICDYDQPEIYACNHMTKKLVWLSLYYHGNWSSRFSSVEYANRMPNSSPVVVWPNMQLYYGRYLITWPQKCHD